MNVDAGRDIRKAILNDSKMTEVVTESPDIVEVDDERDEVYYSENATLDVSGLGNYVETVGDVFYGASVEVPKDTDLNAVASRLVSISRETTGIESPLVWAESTFNTYSVYVECEEILEKAVEEHGDVKFRQEPSDLYSLRINTTTRDKQILYAP